MFGIFKKKSKVDTDSAPAKNPDQVLSETRSPDSSTPAPSTSLFSRLKRGLSKTRGRIGAGIGRIFLGKKEIDDALLEDIETVLLSADVGVEATETIVKALTDAVSRRALKDPEALLNELTDQLYALLEPVEQPLIIEKADQNGPFVLLVVGVNGAGKTTTIGKLAKQFQNQGRSVMLAAGDTFRAAAVEQLQVWGERNDIPVIAQHTGADSASVIYDAMQSAASKGVDILIADTAGRLHTQSNLMDELKKVQRVIQKLDENAPHETLLVLDAGIGQNALIQAEQFNKALGVSGLCLTKLDGTAKGGVIFNIAKRLQIPIRFIGVGEQIDDLRDFSAKEFVEALTSDDSPTDSRE